MSKNCIIKGCKDNSGLSFPFPIDKPTVFLKWIQAIENHQPLPIDYVEKPICSLHFLETDFLKTKKNQINKKSVPSIFPDILDDYVSEGEDIKMEIKIEPEEMISDVVKEKNLRRNRLTIPITEPDSEEGSNDGSDYRDEDDIDTEGSEIDDILENPHVNSDVNASSSLSDLDTSVANESVHADTPLGIEETKDYESVAETSQDILENKLVTKIETLRNEESTLQCMQEIVTNQAKTINKLQEELEKLLKLETDHQRRGKSSDNDHDRDTKTSASNINLVDRLQDYSNVDLQIFAISLYYFSPSVYAYLGSMMPYLPPKNVVIDWVKSGHAFSLFPIGVLEKEKFILQE